MSVEWTSNAIRHLNGIHDYISQDSHFYATRMVDRLTSRSLQIQEHALSGEMVHELGDITIGHSPLGLVDGHSSVNLEPASPETAMDCHPFAVF